MWLTDILITAHGAEAVAVAAAAVAAAAEAAAAEAVAGAVDVEVGVIDNFCRTRISHATGQLDWHHAPGSRMPRNHNETLLRPERRGAG